MRNECMTLNVDEKEGRTWQEDGWTMFKNVRKSELNLTLKWKLIMKFGFQLFLFNVHNAHLINTFWILMYVCVSLFYPQNIIQVIIGHYLNKFETKNQKWLFSLVCNSSNRV